MDDQSPITLFWVKSSKKDYSAFPEEVQDDMGYALFQAQMGDKPRSVKPLTGFNGAGVLEVVENHDTNTYRAVYTVKFEGAVYVLHCFQKKSKSGIGTPQQDIDLVRARLRIAEEHHKEWKKKQETQSTTKKQARKTQKSK